jgi:phosphoenolpyruvate phosphomutase / 2-hydroxyethylphosphonate cytidylyltransferase
VISNVKLVPKSQGELLAELFSKSGKLKFLEAHSALSALIVENTKFNKSDGTTDSFDGIWASSLTDATIKGRPDNESVHILSRFNTLREMTQVSTKPILFDGDSGGSKSNFVKLVKGLSKLGIAGVVIEDKEGLKQNSLLSYSTQKQTSIPKFVEKIKAGKRIASKNNLLIFGRIESLITGVGMSDALERAMAYIAAGADGIMIHSRSSTPDEIFEFCEKFRSTDKKSILIVVPSTFDSATNYDLWNRGVNLVIYANQLLRSAYPAMVESAKGILEHGRALEIRPKMMTIKEVLEIIPENL